MENEKPLDYPYYIYENLFIGEIVALPCQFVPYGLLPCDGKTYPIQQDQYFTVLFGLLGTTFGGDGRTTFGVPNLQGRVINSSGQLQGGGFYRYAQQGGVSSVTLHEQQIPPHTHQMQGATVPRPVQYLQDQPADSNDSFLSNLFIKSTEDTTTGRPGFAYTSDENDVNTVLSNNTISTVGATFPHDNMMPYLAIRYFICVYGIYPERS